MTSGLRERKKLATRLALHEAALRLVAERGLDSVSADDIAARADVSPRTFFNYFPTKEAAILSWDEAASDRAREAVVARPPEEDPYTAVSAVLADVLGLEAAGEVWRRHVLLVRELPELLARSHLVRGQMEEALAAGVAERIGQEPEDLVPLVVATTVLAASRVAIRSWLAAPEATDARAVLAEVLEVQRLSLGR
jgi:AcrR family transcriptional regulator